jgi:hypothetical protein
MTFTLAISMPARNIHEHLIFVSTPEGEYTLSLLKTIYSKSQ